LIVLLLLNTLVFLSAKISAKMSAKMSTEEEVAKNMFKSLYNRERKAFGNILFGYCNTKSSPSLSLYDTLYRVMTSELRESSGVCEQTPEDIYADLRRCRTDVEELLIAYVNNPSSDVKVDSFVRVVDEKYKELYLEDLRKVGTWLHEIMHEIVENKDMEAL